jgi:hypothetical protein
MPMGFLFVLSMSYLLFLRGFYAFFTVLKYKVGNTAKLIKWFEWEKSFILG